MSIVIMAATPRGCRLALQLRQGLSNCAIWTSAATAATLPAAELCVYEGSLAQAVGELWGRGSGLVFILAVGCVVRLIAPHLQDKASDPGVVAVDETGRFVVSVSGGHRGGADALSRRVAALLGVEAVITSASSGQALPALDQLGDPYGWQKGTGDWTAVAAALTQQQPVQVKQTCGWDLWKQAWSGSHSLLGLAGGGEGKEGVAQLWITDQVVPSTAQPRVVWHPRTLWVGVGCERGIPTEVLVEAIRTTLQQHDLAFAAMAGLASLDLKRDERALQELADRYQWPLRFYSPSQLAGQAVPHPSEVVEQAVGTPSVAEAAALQAAQTQQLLVEKQIYLHPQGSCTLAIARAQQEYTPRQGSLALIGMGPGELSQMTAAARAALTQAEVVIGYQLYLELLDPLLHAGQIVEASPITQEITRAQRAITLAQRGLRVAVVSSGDAGIYGMAGLVLQCLAATGWDGEHPMVQTFPGITALQAAAAQLGSPLMQDFCAISLSDLLIPWSRIEERLEAAASSDFVIALYNPRSEKRTAGLTKAWEILQRYRDPQTPVVLARSLYRADQSLTRTTLQAADLAQIDMMTLVLIGNSQTFYHHHYLITPRGYTLPPPPTRDPIC
ncbi:MAG: precorrin-3B C(17)-methyltransferase [Cyanobacteriota bacterium]|nr:precorrin-3B C(17)-methyltransferase [Cyanobacteriota bacterium]